MRRAVVLTRLVMIKRRPQILGDRDFSWPTLLRSAAGVRVQANEAAAARSLLPPSSPLPPSLLQQPTSIEISARRRLRCASLLSLSSPPLLPSVCTSRDCRGRRKVRHVSFFKRCVVRDGADGGVSNGDRGGGGAQRWPLATTSAAQANDTTRERAFPPPPAVVGSKRASERESERASDTRAQRRLCDVPSDAMFVDRASARARPHDDSWQSKTRSRSRLRRCRLVACVELLARARL